MEKESYLLELARYIVLNPVRAEMVHSPEQWRWSSYRATVGQVPTQKWLQADWLLAAFGAHKGQAIEAYKRFVAEGKGQPSPWAMLRNQVFLGDDDFVKHLQGRIDDKKTLSEIPSSQRRAKPKELSTYVQSSKSRNAAIVDAYASGGYSMKAVGDYFGLHYSTVSGIISNHKSKT